MKQVPYLKFKWLQRDSNPQPFSLKTNTKPFSQTGQMIELCCQHWSVQCIWLCFYCVTYAFCQGTPCLKQARHLVFKWLQRESRKKLKRERGFSMRGKFLSERKVSGTKVSRWEKTFFLLKKDKFMVTFLMNRFDFLEISSNEQIMSSFLDKVISFQT